ncbi:MAG: hypothetical protein GF372_11045 [Candidatus Marinimicrobia bacterium]|nr:hypothetical protein [Candidatus Neomarinimicrobiota bacterium]
MKRMLCTLLLVLAFFPVSYLAGQTLQDSLNYEWGTIHFSPDSETLARNSASQIEESIAELHNWLGFELHTPMDVLLISNPKQYRSLAGYLPAWAAGAANYDKNQIILKSPSLGKSDLRSYSETLKHEVAHIILGQNINPARLPRWLNEGIAMLVTGEYSMQHTYTLAQAAVGDDLIPLQEIEQINQYSRQRALLGYAQSQSAVKYIQSEFPPGTLKNVLMHLQMNDVPYNQAFQEVAGVSQFYFEWHWKKYVKTQYNWLTMLSSDIFIWILFPVLAILAYFAIRWRNKRKMQQWEEDESQIDSDSDWDYEYMPDEDEQWKGDRH